MSRERDKSSIGQMHGIGIMAFVLFLSTLVGVPVLPHPAYDPEDDQSPAGAMDGRGAMKFVFMTFCDGMNETGEGTWAHVFSKGLQTGSVVIGMTGGGGKGIVDWATIRWGWIPTFFKLAFGQIGESLVNPDLTFKWAFDEACDRTWGGEARGYVYEVLRRRKHDLL